MINGTFKIQNYLSKTNLETNYIVLKEGENGELKGFMGEILFKEPAPVSGIANPDGTFKVSTGKMSTIMKDVCIDIEGQVIGDDIKGFIQATAKMPMFGKKVADYMSAGDFLKYKKENDK